MHGYAVKMQQKKPIMYINNGENVTEAVWMKHLIPKDKMKILFQYL